MRLEHLHAMATEATERMAYIGEAYTERVAVDGPTVLALLDVAQAAEAVTSYKTMGAVHVQAGRTANYCDTCLREWPCEGAVLAEALDRLREVTG